jgi:hypothetical protein
VAHRDRSALPGLHRKRRGLEDGDIRNGCDSSGDSARHLPAHLQSCGQIKVGAAVLVGAVAGAIGGATWVATQRFQSSQEAGVARIIADRAQDEKASGEKQVDKKED